MPKVAYLLPIEQVFSVKPPTFHQLQPSIVELIGDVMDDFEINSIELSALAAKFSDELVSEDENDEDDDDESDEKLGFVEAVDESVCKAREHITSVLQPLISGVQHGKSDDTHLAQVSAC